MRYRESAALDEESILADLKPEAAYFTDDSGQRTAFVVLEMQDASQIPAIAEPWFLAFNASIEIHPVMVAVQSQPLGHERFYAKIARMTGQRREAARVFQPALCAPAFIPCL